MCFIKLSSHNWGKCLVIDRKIHLSLEWKERMQDLVDFICEFMLKTLSFRSSQAFRRYWKHPESDPQTCHFLHFTLECSWRPSTLILHG